MCIMIYNQSYECYSDVHYLHVTGICLSRGWVHKIIQQEGLSASALILWNHHHIPATKCGPRFKCNVGGC